MPSAPTNMQGTVCQGPRGPSGQQGRMVISECLGQQEAAELGRGLEGPAWLSAMLPASLQCTEGS